MSTSYTSLLGLALPATGELSGAWGDTVNNYISNYVDSAVAGALTVTTDVTLIKSTGTSLGATSAQYAIIIASPASANITITAPASSKTYLVINTSTTYTATFKASGQTGVVLHPGTNATFAYNGTDFVVVGGYLGIPKNSQSANYTTVLGDAGKHIYHPTTDANTRTYTIDGSLPYPVGSVISFVNMTSQSVTISLSTGTLYLANLGVTGSRTLGQYGVANALKLTSTTWIITGTALV